MNETKQDHARQGPATGPWQAEAKISSIAEMVARLQKAKGDKAQEAAHQDIQEDPLSVRVRGGWYDPCDRGDESRDALEYEILLCTGGPAVRLIGRLDQYSQPETATIEHQDWGTPWTEYSGPAYASCSTDTLLAYARCFYFGE